MPTALLPLRHPAGVGSVRRAPALVDQKRNYAEQKLQIAITQFLKHALSPEDGVCFAVPNGGLRTKSEAALLKATGVLAGVTDLVFLFRQPSLMPPFGLMEVKSKTGVLSDDQKAFRDLALSLGAHWACCRSLEAVERTLLGWCVPLKARLT